MAGAGGQMGRGYAGGEGGQEQATGEFEEDLEESGGIVVFDSERAEAEGEEERDSREGG